MKTMLKTALLCFVLGQTFQARAEVTPEPGPGLTTPAPAADQQNLQGEWYQPCRNQVLRMEDFKGNEVTLTENFFGDTTCKTPLLVFLNEGTYTLPQAGWMNFRFTAVLIRLTDARLVADFNQRKMCGITDWQLNKERTISGQLCEIFYAGQRAPAAGDMRYGIYRLDNDRLTFGKLSRANNATTPEKRPTDWETQPYLKVPQRVP